MTLRDLVDSSASRVGQEAQPETAATREWLAALLLAAGAKGKRYALPNSRILLHEPSMSGLSGQATDIDIHAREILRMRAVINKLLAKHSGQSMERIEKDVNRDFIMDAEEAQAYGIVDEIIHEKRR